MPLQWQYQQQQPYLEKLGLQKKRKGKRCQQLTSAKIHIGSLDWWKIRAKNTGQKQAELCMHQLFVLVPIIGSPIFDSLIVFWFISAMIHLIRLASPRIESLTYSRSGTLQCTRVRNTNTCRRIEFCALTESGRPLAGILALSSNKYIINRGLGKQSEGQKKQIDAQLRIAKSRIGFQSNMSSVIITPSVFKAVSIQVLTGCTKAKISILYDHVFDSYYKVRYCGERKIRELTCEEICQ